VSGTVAVIVDIVEFGGLVCVVVGEAVKVFGHKYRLFIYLS